MFSAVYPGKLLLFGEYAVLQGAQALAMPLPAFSGHFSFPEGRTEDERTTFYDWHNFLILRQEAGGLGCRLDLAHFHQDIGNGLRFSSNIPQGYGAGSSGALTAALYDRYVLDRIGKEEQAEYPRLKRILGGIESFFHGTSSGADPLVSYLNRPLLFDHDGAIRAVSLAPPAYTIYLLDTGKPRQTAPLVQAFQRHCADEHYRARVQAELLPATEEAIAALLQGRTEVLFESWQTISLFQYRYMQDMILPEWRSLWVEALADGKHALKLCGAGGGGFVLAISRFADDFLQAYPAFKPMPIGF